MGKAKYAYAEKFPKNHLVHLVNLFQTDEERQQKYWLIKSVGLNTSFARRMRDWRLVRIEQYLNERGLLEPTERRQDQCLSLSGATILTNALITSAFITRGTPRSRQDGDPPRTAVMRRAFARLSTSRQDAERRSAMAKKEKWDRGYSHKRREGYEANHARHPSAGIPRYPLCQAEERGKK